VILWLGSGADGLEVAGLVHLLGGAGNECGTGAGQDLEAEVAASFGPFVVLLGEDGAGQADEGVAAGEDPDDVGAPADLAVQPLLGYLEPAR
jgi:hypothetical protein